MLNIFEFVKQKGKAPNGEGKDSPRTGKARKGPMKASEAKPAPVIPSGLIGVDEAGRGPVMGPLVVVALRVNDDAPLRDLNVKDSKALRPGRREELYGGIMAVSKVSVEVISAEEIDELRGSRTMNEIELDVFAAAIGKLLHDGDVVYVDAADVRERYFGEEIAKRLKAGRRDARFEMVSRHKADAIYPVVSAASIIAKVTRDRIIVDIGKELRKTLDKPMGSGYPSDPITISFMENWIKKEGDLPPHTRRSWDTARHLLEMSKTTTLDNYGMWAGPGDDGSEDNGQNGSRE
jgi:ribonuclease HII